MNLSTVRRGCALVTGGAGFLGSHLCERLLRDGWKVICVDNFVTGRPGNLARFAAHPGLRILRHDVTESAPQGWRVDRIYNLACPASPAHYQADPLKTLRTCLLGAINLLELAHRCGARLLQASTSEVYGDPQQHPQAESYWGHVNPLGPRSCYDEGKRCAETLCLEYAHTKGVDARIARIFNTYGPRMAPDDGRVVSNFIIQALEGRPLTVYGTGMQTRSFCYVGDLVEGLLRLMESPEPLSAVPVNLGNPVEMSMIELANLVRELARSRSPLVFRPRPADDPAQRRPDISVAGTRLGWRPEVSPRDGVARTVAYFAASAGAVSAAATQHADVAVGLNIGSLDFRQF